MNQIWVWSTAIQTTSLLMIAVFFVVLGRSVRFPEVRIWIWAWVANLYALLVTAEFWYFQEPIGGFVRASYMGGKSTFVLLLVLGAWTLKQPGLRLVPTRYLAAGLLAFAAVCAALPLAVEQVGLIQHASMGSVLVLGGLLLKAPPRGLGWLRAGLFIRGTLALVEAAAYGSTLIPPSALAPDLAARVPAFLSVHSSIDNGVEWLIALGCVIAVSEKVQRELRQANADLLAAQADLRRLADRDPLTASSRSTTSSGTTWATSASSGSPTRCASASGRATWSCATRATSSWWWRRGCPKREWRSGSRASTAC
jgi:hypothetical protein